MCRLRNDVANVLQKLLKGSCDLQVPGRLKPAAAQTKFLCCQQAVRSADPPNERCHDALLCSTHRVLTVVCSSCLQDVVFDIFLRRDRSLRIRPSGRGPPVGAVHKSGSDSTIWLVDKLANMIIGRANGRSEGQKRAAAMRLDVKPHA